MPVGIELIERLCFATDGPRLQMCDVAKRIGVAKSYVSMVWNGRQKCSEQCERKMSGILYTELTGVGR